MIWEGFSTKVTACYKEGKTLNEVLGKVDDYQRLVRRAYGYKSPLKRPMHRIGTSKIGLSTLAYYEYGRSRGLPLPDSNKVIESMVPLRDVRRVLCSGKAPAEDRQDLIDFN